MTAPAARDALPEGQASSVWAAGPSPGAGSDEGATMNAALAALREGRLAEAARLCESLVAAHPDAFDSHYLLALTRSRAGDHQAALASYDRALMARPGHAEAHYNRGNALLRLQRFEEALAECRNAVALGSAFPEAAHLNGAVALIALKQFQQAARSAEEALRLRPGFAEAHKIRGDALLNLDRLADAEACYRRALELRKGYVPALAHLCVLLQKTKRYDEAAAALGALRQIEPDRKFVLGMLIYSKMYCGDWSDLDRLNEELLEGIRSHRLVVSPFILLALPSTPADQLANARRYSPARPSVLMGKPPLRRDRIRVAYLSGDFRRQPQLTVGLFEKHDRTKFEVIAVSFTEGLGAGISPRMEKAFDRVIDARRMEDLEVARLLSDMDVDIAVDLMGYTEHSRPGILAHRPAPIQVAYLGFPGTMGTGHIDYILADRHVIPDSEKAFYAEQVVHLPDSYQANDDRRPISDEPQSRAAHGLDDTAFVFCCFCASYKITADVFAAWMRLLRELRGSVLWLLGTNEPAARNLRQIAASHGVAPDRLVFAPRVEVSKHLARHRLADLALDTLPYNGHTTASDALWAGLPVITRAGGTFAGRVAASLLHAAGLPELVTDTARQYEELALRLATDRPYLQRIRRKLADNRLTLPLFDTDRFRRHVEAAYRTMWDVWQQGERPRSFSVEAISDSGARRREQTVTERPRSSGRCRSGAADRRTAPG